MSDHKEIDPLTLDPGDKELDVAIDKLEVLLDQQSPNLISATMDVNLPVLSDVVDSADELTEPQLGSLDSETHPNLSFDLAEADPTPSSPADTVEMAPPPSADVNELLVELEQVLDTELKRATEKTKANILGILREHLGIEPERPDTSLKTPRQPPENDDILPLFGSDQEEEH